MDTVIRVGGIKVASRGVCDFCDDGIVKERRLDDVVRVRLF